MFNYTRNNIFDELLNNLLSRKRVIIIFGSAAVIFLSALALCYYAWGVSGMLFLVAAALFLHLTLTIEMNRRNNKVTECRFDVLLEETAVNRKQLQQQGVDISKHSEKLARLTELHNDLLALYAEIKRPQEKILKTQIDLVAAQEDLKKGQLSHKEKLDLLSGALSSLGNNQEDLKKGQLSHKEKLDLLSDMIVFLDNNQEDLKKGQLSYNEKFMRLTDTLNALGNVQKDIISSQSKNTELVYRVLDRQDDLTLANEDLKKKQSVNKKK